MCIQKLPSNLRFIKSAVSFDFFTYKPYPNFESGWLDKPRGQGLLEVDQSVARRRQEAELAESRDIQKTLTEKIELEDRQVQQCRRDLKQVCSLMQFIHAFSHLTAFYQKNKVTYVAFQMQK